MTKKIYISRDVRFDEGYTYDSKLNDHQKKVAEFWSPKNDKQLAFQEKKQDDAISKSGQEVVGGFRADIAMENKGLSIDIDDEFSLSSLEDDEPLIPLQPKAPSKDNFDHFPTQS